MEPITFDEYIWRDGSKESRIHGAYMPFSRAVERHPILEIGATFSKDDLGFLLYTEPHRTYGSIVMWIPEKSFNEHYVKNGELNYIEAMLCVLNGAAVSLNKWPSGCFLVLGNDEAVPIAHTPKVSIHDQINGKWFVSWQGPMHGGPGWHVTP